MANLQLNRRGFLASTAALSSASLLPGKPAGAVTPQTDTLVPRTIPELYIPRIQFWSFDNRDPVVKTGPLSCSFQIFTTGPEEDSFGLLTDRIKVESTGRSWTVHCSQLAGPGQQFSKEGSFTARVSEKRASQFHIEMEAQCAEPIRAIKMRLHDLPQGRIAQTGWETIPNFLPLPEHGINFNYPEYQGGMPVWFLETDAEQGISFRSLDLTPRPKRFVVYPSDSNATVELVFEQFGNQFGPKLSFPAWEITFRDTLPQAIDRRRTGLETEVGLRPWEQRPDVPEWARQIRLVVTVHGMHWSGYIFNDYRRTLEHIRRLTGQIEGKHVLVFLAGWEGRYYRSYGHSVPNERMGGDAGFRELISGIHQTGAHVMAMYGGNYPQPGTPGYDTYASTSKLQTSDGFRWSPMRGYVVDWGQLRGTGMSGGGPAMNPGAPAWRDFLTRQVSRICSTYGVDGAFFDTQPTTGNDAYNDPVEGLRQICSDLRAAHPEILIATESWFDLSLGFVPSSQTPGGPGNWSRRYQRRFAHLSMGEPSRGSTGVHELGHLPYRPDELLTLFDWPTLALVEDTMKAAPRQVADVIAAAQRYSGG